MNILTEDRGPVRIVTLNRPAVRNAIDIPLRVELAEALEAADSDDSVRAIVLTGAGGVFCSGGDISTMGAMAVQEALDRAQLAQSVIRAIWASPKPVLAAVEGAAFGAGAALAAACDHVVAARDARFATTFTNVGLAGDMGVYVSLPRRIGVARTRRMLLMPEPFAADVALEWGLVDGLSDPGTALAVTVAAAERLARGPAEALGVIKMMLALAPTLSPLEVLDREAEEQARLFGSDDFVEGIDAFRNKRRPLFTHKQGASP